MKKQVVIKVFDFAEFPGPRYKSQGLDSGEEFYYSVAKESFANALENNQQLIVDLDYTAGYAPSFIDEVFGNFIYDFEYEDINKSIKIKSEEEPHWVEVVLKEVWPKWLKKFNAGEPRKPSD